MNNRTCVFQAENNKLMFRGIVLAYCLYGVFAIQ